MAGTSPITARAVQGDTVDMICQRHLGTTAGGVIEATLSANPGLAALGPVLPAGTTIKLIPQSTTADESVKLWD